MTYLFGDIPLAFRSIQRRPAFASLVVSILALAIGATSAIYTVVEALLLRPLPFAEAERLVMVWERNVVRNRDRNVVGPANFMAWRDRAQTLSGIAAFSGYSVTLSGSGDPERLQGGASSGNLFSVLGVSPLLGRTLIEDDSKPGAPNVAVLTEALWRRRFAADPNIVGKNVTLNGRPATIVGVLDKSFQLLPGADLWAAFEVNESMRTARGRWMNVVARLAPGMTAAQASDDMKRLHAQLEVENKDFNAGWSTSVYPLQGDLVRSVRPALVVLMGAVLLMLLVASANVANLMLGRAIARERDLAVQKAMGASPGRIAQQLLTEGVLLSLAGAAGGLLLATVILKGLSPMIPSDSRFVADLGLNASVVGFAIALSVGVALFFGAFPAFQQLNASLGASLKDGAARGASRTKKRFKHGLVIAEVALSLVLTAGTGVLLRSFWKLIHVDPGFDSTGVLTTEVSLPSSRYSDGAKQAAFFEEAVKRIAQAPGVKSVSMVSWAPLGRGSATGFKVLDREAPPAGKEPVADVRVVTPNLFSTMGIPLLAGRDITERDRSDRPTVVVVNRALAEEFWPGQSPIGKRIAMSWGDDKQAEIVGVVGDVHLASLATAPRPTLYWGVNQLPNNFMTLAIKTAAREGTVGPAIRAAIASLDKDLALTRVRPLAEIVDQSVDRERFLLDLLAAFAVLAVLLAGAGVYGVLAYTVIDRIPEMGVRLAIGARPRDILRLVVKEGLALGVMGVGVGISVALLAARSLEELLFETSARDPLSIAAVSLLLLLVCGAASLLPARRASRIEPLKALRAE